MAERGLNFKQIRKLQPRRNLFNLTHTRKFSAQPFFLYPVLVEDVIPGDKWRLDYELVVRTMPMVLPIMHDIQVYMHYYFVPYRSMWSNQIKFLRNGAFTEQEIKDLSVDFERYLSQGDGFQGGVHEYIDTIPRLGVGKQKANNQSWAINWTFEHGCIVDYLYRYSQPMTGTSYYSRSPTVEPLMAYNWIYWEYYRDQTHFNLQTHPNFHLMLGYNRNLQDRSITCGIGSSRLTSTQRPLFWKRSWSKEYFTSALPWQQKGISPALPISGIGNAVFSPIPNIQNGQVNAIGWPGAWQNAGQWQPVWNSQPSESTADATARQNAYIGWLNQNTINLSTLTSVNINELRDAVQLQKWMERNARGGSRYTELLQAHHGRAPKDETLDRPVYIGGGVTPIIISEVLQTSYSQDSPLGQFAGHGISADRTHAGTWDVNEYGLIMGLMSIMPELDYVAQGIPREWDKETIYDYFWQEFKNLSEQAVFTRELYNTFITGGSLPAPEFENRIFGYQGRYDEYRYRNNSIHGDLKKGPFNQWHMARNFTAEPFLNEDFITPNNNELMSLKRSFYDTNMNSNNFVITLRHILPRIVRPLDWVSTPGFLDHN